MYQREHTYETARVGRPRHPGLRARCELLETSVISTTETVTVLASMSGMKPGDIVKPTARFVDDTATVAAWPTKGVVRRVHGPWVEVEWSDGTHGAIRPEHIEPEKVG